MIGSLKEEVLIAISASGPDVVAVEIYEKINAARLDERGKGLSFAAVFNTIQRLLADELLGVSDGPIRRGKPMAAYSINGKGQRALNKADAIRSKLREARPPNVGGAINA